MWTSAEGSRRCLHGFGLLAALLGFAACDNDGPASPDPDTPEPRTFQMGFAPTPPRATLESLIETIEEIAEVSELALIQQPTVWDSIRRRGLER